MRIIYSPASQDFWPALVKVKVNTPFSQVLPAIVQPHCDQTIPSVVSWDADFNPSPGNVLWKAKEAYFRLKPVDDGPKRSREGRIRRFADKMVNPQHARLRMNIVSTSASFVDTNQLQKLSRHKHRLIGLATTINWTHEDHIWLSYTLVKKGFFCAPIKQL